MGKGCRRPASRACRRRSASRPRASAAKAARRQSLLHGSRLRPRLTAQATAHGSGLAIDSDCSTAHQTQIASPGLQHQHRGQQAGESRAPRGGGRAAADRGGQNAVRTVHQRHARRRPITVPYPSHLSESPIRVSHPKLRRSRTGSPRAPAIPPDSPAPSTLPRSVPARARALQPSSLGQHPLQRHLRRAESRKERRESESR